jgi:hypothetical protein
MADTSTGAPQDPQPSFFEQVLAGGRLIPPSHKPVLSDLVDLVAGLIGHAQFGKGFLEAVADGEHAVLGLISPEYVQPEDPAAAPPIVAAPVTTGLSPAAAPLVASVAAPAAAVVPATSDAALEGEVARLNTELQSLQVQLAAAQRTQVSTVTPQDTPAPAPASSSASSSPANTSSSPSSAPSSSSPAGS